MPAVIIVGADKGGVGKTTVARTLLDYFIARNIAVRAFDTECPRGTLKRFFPEVTEIVNLTAVRDQMRIFDTLSDGTVTLIDVGAGLLSSTLTALRDIGFFDAARKGEITLLMFHVLGPSIASLDEIAETAAFTAEARYFLVKNFINNTRFFEWDQATYDSYFHRVKGAVEITVPNLDAMACERVELASTSYASFIASHGPNGYSFVLRGYVRHWLGRVWAEYDRVDLPRLIDPAAALPAFESAE